MASSGSSYLDIEPEWADEESGWRSAEEILTAGRPELAAQLLQESVHYVTGAKIIVVGFVNFFPFAQF
jgi:hypothetical protein